MPPVIPTPPVVPTRSVRVAAPTTTSAVQVAAPAAGQEESPPPPPLAAAGLPSTQKDAPSVDNLKADAQPDGTVLLTWTGTTTTTWGKSVCVGYNVYRQGATGWVLFQAEVYPPIRVAASPGDVFGVAPVYLLPDGSFTAGGAAQTTVGK